MHWTLAIQIIDFSVIIKKILRFRESVVLLCLFQKSILYSRYYLPVYQKYELPTV